MMAPHETGSVGAMMPRINLYLLALALLATAPAAAQRYDALDSCELVGSRNLSVSARCGQLEVAENPDQPDGRRISLAFAVVPARASQAQPDPVFFLAGGPGQSARDVAPLISAALRDLNRNRDLIFLDQRGTGGSNALNCITDSTDESDWLEMDYERIEQALKACQEDWDADVRFYTSSHAAADLIALADHLEFGPINLIGGSYGTRLAQVVMRHYPERIRSVVLDAVVPTRLSLGSEHAIKLDAALARLFERCEATPSCREQFPDLDRALDELIERYRGQQERMVVTHPRTGQGIEIDFNDMVLASALRFLAYDPMSQSIIPYLVHEAATTGSPERLASQAMIVSDQLSDQIALGLNFAVGCSEDWPVWPRDIDSSDTLLGDTMLEFYDAICHWWPTGPTDPDFHTPFDHGHPVLILSGELDPVTPPEYGDEAAAQYAESLHLVGRGLGHIAMTQPCFGSIIARFIDAASVSELDTGCIERLGPPPFFTDLLGPLP